MMVKMLKALMIRMTMTMTCMIMESTARTTAELNRSMFFFGNLVFLAKNPLGLTDKKFGIALKLSTFLCSQIFFLLPKETAATCFAVKMCKIFSKSFTNCFSLCYNRKKKSWIALHLPKNNFPKLGKFF